MKALAPYQDAADALIIGVPWRWEAHFSFGSIRKYPVGVLIKAYDWAASRAYHDSAQRRRWPALPETWDRYELPPAKEDGE